MLEQDPRQTLSALVARLEVTPRRTRPAVVRLLLPLLASESLPLPVRIAAAARTLRFIPDRPAPVRRVARALTAGLAPVQIVERLRLLQNQIEKSRTLDELIETRERRIKLPCPRCRAQLARPRLIKHLWQRHRLVFDNGQFRPLLRVLDEYHQQHVASEDQETLDQVVALAGPAGMRRWLAGEDPPVQDLVHFLTRAAENGEGLCPGCYGAIPAAALPTPAPLTLVNGRLTGEGFAVELRATNWFRTLVVTDPYEERPVVSSTFTPRGSAAIAASVMLVFTLWLAPLVSYAVMGILLAMLIYFTVRLIQKRPVVNDGQLIDSAWTRLARRLADEEYATEFLTRLCLASQGQGRPERRAQIVQKISARAEERGKEWEEELQLLAAVRVLHLEDEAQNGRDLVAGVVSCAAHGFAGHYHATYAEYVVGAYLSRERDPGELARLRILLLSAAFDAGLVPRDLLDLWAGAPALKQAMSVEPTHRLGLLFGLWRSRNEKSWSEIGEANTVFDLARASAPGVARILAKFPDVLLFHRPERAVEDLVGPVLICSRGVAVGGFITADPDAEVRLLGGGRTLLFGRHQIEVPRKLPLEFPALIRQWLEYRAEELLPYIDGYLSPGSGKVAPRILRPFCTRCPICRSHSTVSPGCVGRLYQR
jgi:hypothetical protein